MSGVCSSTIPNTYDYPDEEEDHYANPDDYRRRTYCAIPDVDESILLGERVGTSNKEMIVTSSPRPAPPPLRPGKDVIVEEKENDEDGKMFLTNTDFKEIAIVVNAV